MELAVAHIDDIDLKLVIVRVLSAGTDDLVEEYRRDREAHESAVNNMIPFASAAYGVTLPVVGGAIAFAARDHMNAAVPLAVLGCATFLIAEWLDRKIRHRMCELAAIRGRITGACMLLQRFGFDMERKP